MLDAVFLVTTKSLTLFLGCVVTTLAFRAYRRTRLYPLRALSAGFGLITVGSIIGGVLHQLLDVGLPLAQNVQSLFVAAGFIVVTYSLYATYPDDTSGAVDS